MKSEPLLNAIGEIRDEYILEAERADYGMRRRRRFYSVTASAVCFIIAAAFILAVLPGYKAPIVSYDGVELSNTTVFLGTKQDSRARVSQDTDVILGVNVKSAVVLETSEGTLTVNGEKTDKLLESAKLCWSLNLSDKRLIHTLILRSEEGSAEIKLSYDENSEEWKLQYFKENN